MNKQFFIIIFLFFVAFKVSADSSGFTVTPMVIQETVRPRDILDYEIKVKNLDKPYRAFLYPIVNDVSLDGNEATTTIRFKSLSKWIEIPRAQIDLMPGQEKIVPLKITVDSNAIPGTYHAIIKFSEGPNGYEAESNSRKFSYPQIIINYTVTDNIVESGQLKEFRPEKEIFIKNPVYFRLIVTNNGNKEIVPRGFLFIYNRRHQEIDKIDINPDLKIISPGAQIDLSQIWNPPQILGKFKAKLEIEYGEKISRDINDTVYFWILPWKIILIFVVLVIIFIILVWSIIKRKNKEIKDILQKNQKENFETIINLKNKNN